MKKITVTVFALAMAMGGFAQKKNVSAAEGNLYEPVNLTEAKSQIEAAMKDPSTANWSKTYYIAGQVYFKIYEKGANERGLKMQYSQDEMSEALLQSVNAYLKCGDLDQKPDEKGKIKPKYTKDVVKNVKTYAEYIISEGQEHQKKGENEKAIKMMQAYLELPNNELMKNENIQNSSIYNDVKFLVVNLAASVPAKRPLMIQYMNDLKKAGYKEETMYEWLSDAYSSDKQYDKMLQELQEGIKKYPSNKYLIGNMINYYLDNNKEQEAVQYLDAAIQKDPNNAQYYMIKGEMLIKKNQFDDAAANLKKATELDPSNFNAQYECGLAYEKKGEEIMDAAVKIKDVKKYNAQKTKAIDEFKKSLPFFEKARQINGDDEMNLRFLRSVYYKLSMNDKYSEVDKAIKAIEAKK